MAFRFLYLFLIAPFSPALAGAGGSPGTVVVIGETPESIAFQVPGDSPYKFQYDPARITLWDTVDKQNAIPPGAVFTAGPGVPGCEVDLSDFAALQSCFSGKNGGVVPGCTGSDTDADNDIDLEDYATFHATIVGPLCTIQTIPTFVEGLTASTSLSDVQITLLIDPDVDGEFTVEAIQPVTVVSISITPTSGALGTAVTITLQPAIAPLAFGPLTTAEWSGVFQPIQGPSSDPFTMTYSISQFLTSSPSIATVIVGGGDGLPPLPPEGILPGSMVGAINIVLASHDLDRSFDFQIAGSVLDWFRLDYPQDEFEFLDDPPMLSATPLDKIPIYEVPSAGAMPEFLSVAFFYHTACVLLLAENSFTVAVAPASFTVDLISFDSSGVEVDRVLGVVLALDAMDGDPDHLTYHSDLARPIVHVEGTIDKQQFPDQIILLGNDGGTVTAMEAAP